MFQISNHHLSVKISAIGAELQSIFHHQTKLEYLWSGDPAFWGKKSPVLFPIVGGLKNNQYRYQQNTYQMNRHGFAREREFMVKHQTESSIQFALESDHHTRRRYPFDFVFYVEYHLKENELFVKYIVENKTKGPLYFSVGAHPAFRVPVTETALFEDYYLLFDRNEQVGIYPLSAEGLIEKNTVPFLQNNHEYPLTKELFYKDALVFKDLESTSIGILCHQNAHGLKMHFHDFPYMGIWSAKEADFVCIEPWCGIADSVDSSGELTEKEGIHRLDENGVFAREWSVELF